MRSGLLRLSRGNHLGDAGEPLTCECAYASIERRDNALAAVCDCQQVRVGELPIGLQSSLQALDGSRDLEAVRPEFVAGVTEVLVEKCQCLGWSESVSREGRIRDNSDESKLGERARGPARVRASGEPAMRCIMMLMSRP